MKKFIYIFLLLCLKAGFSHAQVNLVLEKGEILEPKDTVRLGDSIHVKMAIKNTGDTIYKGKINVLMRTNHEKAPITFTETYNIEPGKTANVKAVFPIKAPYFKQNQKTIIVIWPTGTGTVINGDSLRETVTTLSSVSVQSQKNNLSHVRFYPNPASDRIFFQTQNISIQIAEIYITDVSGKMVYTVTKNEINAGALNLENYKPGLYFMQVHFTNGYRGNHRIIKTN